MPNWKCEECGRVHRSNPARCRDCGNSVLKQHHGDPERRGWRDWIPFL
jgi:rRNA maturation endonuclease Nob1